MLQNVEFWTLLIVINIYNLRQSSIEMSPHITRKPKQR